MKEEWVGDAADDRGRVRFFRQRFSLKCLFMMLCVFNNELSSSHHEVGLYFKAEYNCIYSNRGLGELSWEATMVVTQHARSTLTRRDVFQIFVAVDREARLAGVKFVPVRHHLRGRFI
jgi:hypothetical protein